ncbi:hypothetical protein [Corynebacterium halotolerans]|uniref:Uncharacterized protein n=1 Tax=Corynebacterium halotolerans YIM 70093 = DSM 44683 TaxID=1121362 RepID=M1NWX6_9CORY|nr:hypothetical protein [Corynebacterium halotolerans]AGF71975.1 hypothetical protein A605_04835 [Corynebacterium halotolerans YIM 70093 = DSM 44683]
MKLRNLLATAGATVIAATALAPAASAQNLGEEFIADLNCDHLETALTTLDFVDEDTTRNELAAEIREFGDIEIDLGPLPSVVVQAYYAGQIADRALECGIVDEDPASPFAASSEFLENLGLPGVPELQALSSF